MKYTVAKNAKNAPDYPKKVTIRSKIGKNAPALFSKQNEVSHMILGKIMSDAIPKRLNYIKNSSVTHNFIRNHV